MVDKQNERDKGYFEDECAKGEGGYAEEEARMRIKGRKRSDYSQNRQYPMDAEEAEENEAHLIRTNEQTLRGSSRRRRFSGTRSTSRLTTCQRRL